MKAKLILVLLISQIYFIIFSTYLNGQSTSLSFERISIDQGLSNNSINSILQTEDGFLWIATKDGLNRFDGKTFKIFKHVVSDSSSLPENYVMSLYEDKNKNLWIGTWGGGLCKYNSEFENFKNYNNPNSYDNYIQCLIEDKVGNIWFGTLDGGFSIFEPRKNKFTNYSPNATGDLYFPANNVAHLMQDEKTIWIGTWNDGLFAFNIEDKKFEQYLFDSKANPNLVWNISKKSKNVLLLSTNIGLFEFDKKRKTFNNILKDEVVRQTIRDRKNRLWSGTYNYHGIFLNGSEFNSGSNTINLQYSDDDPYTITSNRIRWMYEDRSNNIWIGTEDGLNKLPATKDFYQYRFFPLREKTISGRIVSSIYEGKNNILWVGYGGDGFDKINLNNGKVSHFENIPSNMNSLSANDVVTMLEDSEGFLWIGLSDGGLNKYNPTKNKFERFLHDPKDSNSIKSNWVQQIIELKNGKLLVGTNESLEYLDRKTKKFYKFNPVLPTESIQIPKRISVNSLYEDSENDLWIGTWLDGLYQYSNEEKKLYHYLPDETHNNSISVNKITSILEDSKKNIWIGTHSGGLNKFDKKLKQFSHYNSQNGLSNDVIFGILEDKSNNLWISTMKGLIKFNLSNEHFRIYDMSDGIVNNQFNWHAYFKNDEGVMYFGGINGFVSFYPEMITIDSLVLPVKIISVKVNNNELYNSSLVSKKGIIELTYYQNFFSIEFAVLDFSPTIKHNYLYKLEGLDEQWIQSGSNNIATYTDIKPGEYTFLVKASNADGIWSNSTKINVNIHPAWWMTWWFRVGLFLLLSLIGYLVYKSKINKMLEIERLRLNISRDLHDEIGSNLSSISVESQMILDNDELSSTVREQLMIIKKTSIETMDAIRDIIWFINPNNEWNEELVLKMKGITSKLLLGINWKFNSPPELNLTGMNLEAKRNIFLIYKEILTNIMKHSKAKNCSIEIIGLSDLFKISIIDDGIGFNIDRLKRRSGLVNIQNRAQQVRGKVNINSKVNEGTEIIFELNK